MSAAAAPIDRAIHIWTETLAREGVAVFVSEASARSAATCMLITAPNVLRGGCGHAYLNNVATHPAAELEREFQAAADGGETTKPSD